MVSNNIIIPSIQCTADSIHCQGSTQLLGNLRSTTKFTTTTSVDRESTGARTSVSAGNRKLKMQSLGRTTTALNVNKL